MRHFEALIPAKEIGKIILSFLTVALATDCYFFLSTRGFALPQNPNPLTCAALLRTLQIIHKRPPISGIGPDGRWHIDGISTAESRYAADFQYILTQTVNSEIIRPFFRALIDDRQRRGHTTHVLELFGSGFFVADIESVSSITGLRFEHYSNSPNPNVQAIGEPYRDTPELPEVLGDIFNPLTWLKLSRSMRTRKIPKMDLIVMNPGRPWLGTLTPGSLNMTNDLEATALAFIILNVVKRLSVDGQFYFRIPSSNGSFTSHPLLKQLERDLPGRKFIFYYDRTFNYLSGALIKK